MPPMVTANPPATRLAGIVVSSSTFFRVMPSMTEKVVINEVGPRDGLQNQPRVLAPEQRLQLIRALADAGLPAIEVGSFVSPRAVPAMAGTEAVIAGLPRRDMSITRL